VQLRRSLRADYAGGAGALDAEAIAQVAAESWPVARDADELHEALLTLSVLPPDPEWAPLLDSLVAARRATTVRAGGCALWAAAERLELARAVYGETAIEPPITAAPPPRPLPETREGCAAEILRGWFESTAPLTAAGLSERLALPRDLVDAALAQLEAEGQILRGRFTPGHAGEEPEWCHRRLLARIHRLTIGRLRREIEPVTTADFLRFLYRWQHMAHGTQLHGADGTLQIIRQMQGYEIPAAAWEAEVLPRRIARYSPEFLDELCLAGEVMWGRLSPHPAFDAGGAGGSHRVRPTRVAPLTLFLREDSGWLLAGPAPGAGESLSHAARETLDALTREGASFFADLARATGRLASEVEDALWELVAAGLVTGDGFENLRALVDPKRRRGEGRGRTARPRHAAGRWALLRRGPAPRDPASAADAFARQLLRRWGVMFRDLLARETLAPPWRELLVALRRMEARGEIRGGRFASAFVGEQFALPEALELLRAVRRDQRGVELVEVSTADPLNLAGIILPGPRVSALSAGMVRWPAAGLVGDRIGT
jgi:ATP-dependent Lhr-like helicase